jgi:carbon-monoxide dehydrogenase small subunit
MRTVGLRVNGREISESVDERTSLADFLRDRLDLTATHVRCEQGVCGACTVLLDGEPARSCIAYVALSVGAEVTTLEGLEADVIIVALRQAFTQEHGLQCGYCTPGMLVTARDIIMRLPFADDARVRLELSGNLCRCTGYGGIVRAIRVVLDQRKEGKLPVAPPPLRRLGPVGARWAKSPSALALPASRSTSDDAAGTQPVSDTIAPAVFRPNIEVSQSFALARPLGEVWAILCDLERVVTCLPGASLAGPPEGDRLRGRMAVRLGPITTTFGGEARITRDEARRRGAIVGAGSDPLTRSRAVAEITYGLDALAGDGGTRVAIELRALLTGPLAQFGRGGIVEDLAARLISQFAGNLEREMGGGGTTAGASGAIGAGSLLAAVLASRIRAWLARVFRPRR